MRKPPFDKGLLPRFTIIKPDNIRYSVETLIKKNKDRIKAILAAPKPYAWDTLMQPLEELADDLNKVWSPIGHLHSVMETEDLRKVYNETLPILTEYHTELQKSEPLFQAVTSFALHVNKASLNAAERKIIDNDLRDFKLAGIHLPKDKKARLADLQKKYSELMTKFAENLLDATHGWILHLTDYTQLEGLTQQALHLAKENAKQRNLDGYVITLDHPSYSTAIKSLCNRDLRRQLYEAYVTRASDQGPNKGKWNNTSVMENIMQARHEMAQLLDFANFAEYSLATKMAKKPEHVISFLNDLLKRSKPIALKEMKALATLAKAMDNITTLEAWDIPYYSEKLRENVFCFSQEDLRPYFPIQKVMQGLFTIVNKIYGLTIQEESGIDVWHPDVKFYSVYDANNALRGGFYIDLYAREHKRDGAWMDDCVTRRRLNGSGVQYPVAYLTCNFMPPVNGKPALLTHDDVLTLFHEFGHCLHHMLTKVDYPSVAGINGVPWDAVEFPSQFMEYYCFEKEVLDLIAEHHETHKPMPDDLYQKMLAAKHFQTGLQMVRQLEFSLFDFKLHLHYDPTKVNQIQTILDGVRKETAIINVPAFNRFQHSFAHIFGGGYAAGYYSYKWAEVLSADAYGQFEEKGIFDPATGHSYMKNILEVGGVREPMESFIAFRGREPTVDALLRQNGMN